MTFLIAVLATYRVAFLIAYEEGPFALAERLRSWVIQRWGSKSWQGRGISCPLCISFWLALPTFWLPLWALWWIGVAGAVLVLHRVHEKLGR